MTLQIQTCTHNNLTEKERWQNPKSSTISGKLWESPDECFKRKASALCLNAINPPFARRWKIDDFTPDNDPHGEREFGAFEHEGERIFWKVNSYAPDMEHGSENPADPKQTVRVLTIMLASEY